MSAASCLLSEYEFLCSICLDVFTGPVSTPCGHNFCKACITKHWNSNVQCECPNCKEIFSTKPELRVNTFISEMAKKFRESAQQKARSGSVEQQAVGPAEVPLDNFSGTKLMAFMLFLMCPISIYILPTVLVHKTHEMVQQRTIEAHLKIQEMRRSVELSKEGADREIADGVQVFTALKESVERSQAELIDTIKEKQRETETQAGGFIKELEQEISELEKRRTEVEQLSKSENRFHILQNLLSLRAALPSKNWTEISVRPPSYEGTVVRAVKQLEEELSDQMKKWIGKEELKGVQQYAVDVTLNPDTAHPKLILSDDGKQVHDGDVKKNLPDNPQRFDTYPEVVSKQSFSSGRFYYEVQVQGKTDWDLGVVRESINRKGEIPVSPEDGYWTIVLRNDNEYEALDDPLVQLSLKSQPQKVGVFVDYEEGLVSFYDVDAAALIYSFTGCSFTEKLYPFFSPCLNHGGENSAPLVISPVSHSD